MTNPDRVLGAHVIVSLVLVGCQPEIDLDEAILSQTGPAGGDDLAAGESMFAGEFLRSTDGRFELHYQGSDGNLVLYFQGAPLWASYAFHAPGFLVLQGDGNLVIYDRMGVAQWNTETAGYADSHFYVQNDGNLVLYNSSGKPTWSSGTCCHPEGGGGGGGAPDPALLPAATTAQFPLTTAYDALGVSSLAAGSSYLDPTTGARVFKLTSSVFPTSGASWGHAYSEGNNEVSLPYDGDTRTVHVYTGSGGAHWLIDFSPTRGVSNARQLAGSTTPWLEMGVTFSSDPATPWYAYIATNGGSTVRRYDVRTMTEVPGNGWPVTGETEVAWLHQSESDGLFTWMRGANGSTIVGYEPSTQTKRTYTNAGLNEPRIDRAGRYVGVSMTSPANGIVVWDFSTNSVVWSAGGDTPFAHQASLKRRWYGVNWNITFPAQFWKCAPDVQSSFELVGGPANGSLVYGNGNWLQDASDPDDQWALFSNYGSLYEGGSAWLAPGGLIFVTANGERRLLVHAYNTSSDYTYYSFAKMSSDGHYALFTSNMNGQGRSDLFLAEVPTRKATF